MKQEVCMCDECVRGRMIYEIQQNNFQRWQARRNRAVCEVVPTEQCHRFTAADGRYLNDIFDAIRRGAQ
jgi:hypothetical protein